MALIEVFTICYIIDIQLNGILGWLNYYRNVRYEKSQRSDSVSSRLFSKDFIKPTFLFAKKSTSLFAKISTLLFAKKLALLFPIYIS